MKKYLLKLMKTDLENQKKSLEYWHKMDEKWKQDPFFIKKKKATENRINKIEIYIRKIEVLFP